MNYYREAVKKTRQREKAEKKNELSFDTKLESEDHILEIRDLNTWFYTDDGIVKSVEGISFDIPKGSTVGLVGESGCGKSVTSLSIMRLLEKPRAQIGPGIIRFRSEVLGKDIDLVKTPEKIMEKIRGTEISMIFQEPMTSLNPVFTIGNQMMESIQKAFPGRTVNERKDILRDTLRKVGISGEHISEKYPFELSGGMKQRIMIAMALLGNPSLLIADEPTTALDVTIQAQILDLMHRMKEETGSSILLITHDLGIIAEMADYVVVMYAGKIAEAGTTEDIFDKAAHPYTIALMKSKPVLGTEQKRLFAIRGQVPSPLNRPQGCRFSNRCPFFTAECSMSDVQPVKLSETHFSACRLAAGKIPEWP